MSDESTLADDVRRAAEIMHRLGRAAREGGADKLAQRALVLRRHLRRLAVRLARTDQPTSTGYALAQSAVAEAGRVATEIVQAGERWMRRNDV